MLDLDALINQAKTHIEAASAINELDAVRVEYLGKKGLMTKQLQGLGKLSPEERPKAGQLINQAKQVIQEALNEKRNRGLDKLTE